jgi:hypothetical protein
MEGGERFKSHWFLANPSIVGLAYPVCVRKEYGVLRTYLLVALCR